MMNQYLIGRVKSFEYFRNMKLNLAAPDAFVKIVKWTKNTGL